MSDTIVAKVQVAGPLSAKVEKEGLARFLQVTIAREMSCFDWDAPRGNPGRRIDIKPTQVDIPRIDRLEWPGHKDVVMAMQIFGLEYPSRMVNSNERLEAIVKDVKDFLRLTRPKKVLAVFIDVRKGCSVEL